MPPRISPLFKDAEPEIPNRAGGLEVNGDLRPNCRTGWKALGMTGVPDGVDVPHGPVV
jgi:hypothetical protein